MNRAEAQKIALDWIAQWNARDLDGILAKFADDVVFKSPKAVDIVGKPVELCAGQQLVELLVKRVARSGGQFAVSDPEILLPLPVFSRAHRHQ